MDRIFGINKSDMFSNCSTLLLLIRKHGMIAAILTWVIQLERRHFGAMKDRFDHH